MLTRMPPLVVRTVGGDSRCTGHALLSAMFGSMWSFPADVLAGGFGSAAPDHSDELISTDLSLLRVNSSACSSDSASSIEAPMVSASWAARGHLGVAHLRTSPEQCLLVHGVRAVWPSPLSVAQDLTFPAAAVATIHM